MTLGNPILVLLLFLPNELLDTREDEVSHLTDTHHDAGNRGDHHEQCKDLFLGWMGYVAVHRVRARGQGALGQAGHIITLIDVVQDVEEASVEACLENQARLEEKTNVGYTEKYQSCHIYSHLKKESVF